MDRDKARIGCEEIDRLGFGGVCALGYEFDRKVPGSKPPVPDIDIQKGLLGLTLFDRYRQTDNSQLAVDGKPPVQVVANGLPCPQCRGVQRKFLDPVTHDRLLSQILRA